jgi:ZIP family zinc transporter
MTSICVDAAVDIIPTVIAITDFSGATSLLGAFISTKIMFLEQHLLPLTAFGAGILILAAIFEILYRGEKDISICLTLLVFIVGAILFTVADIIVENDGGGGAGIPVGIGLDSIRDPLAIGASIAVAGHVLELPLLMGI